MKESGQTQTDNCLTISLYEDTIALGSLGIMSADSL